MSVAQMQIGRAGGDGATIVVKDLPANVYAAFSGTVSLLSAFSPATAAYALLENLSSDANLADIQ